MILTKQKTSCSLQMSAKQLKRRRNQKGLGLIEVLVALVVVSFGVLGMASLQLTGMKHSSGGFNRSKALLYAQSMATRIRLNPVAVELADPLTGYAGYDSASENCGTAPVPYCQARPGAPNPPMCSPTELANFDLFTVACGDIGSNGAEKGVIGSLPNGALTVNCLGSTCTGDSAYNVTITWTEGRSRTVADELITKRVQVRLRP